MRTSVLINVFLLFTSLPLVFLKSFSTLFEDCNDSGGQCVYADDCRGEIQDQISHIGSCTEGMVCCQHLKLTFKRSDTFDSPEEKLSARNPSKDDEIQPKLTESNLQYSVDTNPGALEVVRIVNMKVSNDQTKPRVIPRKEVVKSFSEEQDDNIIVFPESSDEQPEDRIQYIRKLYKKFAMDFKKYNTQKEGQLMSKRQFKYSVGYKSAKYCKLYEKHITDNSLLATPLLPNLFPIRMKNNHCSKPLPLIVGGINTTKAEFPHMAGLGYDRGQWIDFLCGGSLISERYVLTAAHCGNTRWGPPIIVRLGTRNLITDEGQNMDVEEVIIHPDYNEPSGYNDIALVKIVTGLVMGKHLRPACLPPPNTLAGEPGHLLTATGWGRTGFGLYSSPNLQKVSLKVMDNVTCEALFLGGRRTLRLPDGIHDSMLCAAGHIDSSHDTCQGDSGGPLQAITRRTKCIYEIIGITSFGKLCGTGLPAIYTRVSSYIHWIENIVWPS